MSNYEIDSERIILGLLLIHERCRDEWMDQIKPGWFADGFLRKVYVETARLHAEAKPIDVSLVAVLFAGSEADIKAVWRCYHAADDLKASPRSMRGHVDKIRSASALRQMQATISQLQPCDTPEDAHRALSQALREIEQTQGGNTTGPVDMATACRSWVSAVELATSGDVPRITTGIASLDRRIGGLMPGDMCVIAARPSMGKTSLMTQILTHASREHPALIFSLEMTRDQLVSRMLTQHSGQPDPLRLLRGGQEVQEHHWQATTPNMQRLNECKLFIDDRPGLDISEIEIVARAFVRKHKVSVIAIDYLQLVTTKYAKRYETVTEISQRIKGLAKACSVPVIALSQLRRPQGVEREPTMSDLRESGQIEQDADQVILLHRDTHDTTKPGKFIVDKNRHGEAGHDYFQWVAHKQTFGECAPDQYARSEKPKSFYQV